jgi:hypothetical protein
LPGRTPQRRSSAVPWKKCTSAPNVPQAVAWSSRQSRQKRRNFGGSRMTMPGREGPCNRLKYKRKYSGGAGNRTSYGIRFETSRIPPPVCRSVDDLDFSTGLGFGLLKT